MAAFANSVSAPLHGSLAFGGVVAAPIDVSDGAKVYAPSSKRRRDHPDVDDSSDNSLIVLVIGIIITLVIFIVIISIYDVIKERIIVKYTRTISKDKRVVTTDEEAEKINLTARASFDVSVAFSVISAIIAAITLPILFFAYQYFSC